jgi:hypothetical protein
MPIDSSVRSDGKLYNPLVRKAERVISRMTAKWGAYCDLYYCQNDLSTLDLYQINTDNLKYNNVPDVENIKLCLPALWENYGVNDFNIASHSSEEKEDSIFTLPDIKIPLLTKVVARANNTNRVYIIRKTVLEHYNLNELFLQYLLDIMPSDDAKEQMADISQAYSELSIFNADQGIVTEELLPQGVRIDKIGR